MKFSLNTRRLIKNYFSLSTLQASYYLFPLITFPYIVRVLGADVYGLVVFASAFVNYFTIVSDYGFNLSAVREISINRDDKEKLTEIFSSVLLIKTGLFILITLAFVSLIESIPLFSKESRLYYLSYVSVCGTVLSPTWLFQGLEKMEILAANSIIIRGLSIFAIFALVNEKADFYQFVTINSVTAFLVGLSGIYLALRRIDVHFKFQPFSVLSRHLKSGWHLFLSNISISLYTTSQPFFLGLIGGNNAVGYFATADKIRSAVQGLFSILSQTIFPYFSKLFADNHNEALRKIKKITFFAGTFSVVLCFFVFTFSAEIIFLIAGSGYTESVLVLKILAFIPFIIFLSNISGIQIMLNNEYQKQFMIIVSLAAIINISLTLFFVPGFLHNGTALSFLITETFVTAMMAIFITRRGLLFRIEAKA